MEKRLLSLPKAIAMDIIALKAKVCNLVLLETASLNANSITSMEQP
jgi:hypothetical protein